MTSARTEAIHMGEPGTVIEFDRAAYDGGAAAPCAQCKKPIEGQYWKVRSSAICGTCRAGLEAALARATSGASLGKAALRGGGVALACGAGYAAFVAVTNYQLAFLTIAIAFVIAKVVRKASSGVGGLRFQILAVALTYLASSMGYLPGIWRGLTESPRHTSHAAQTAHGASPEGAADAVEPPPPRPSALQLAAVLVKLAGILLGIALAAPFLEATQAPLGLLIVGFGLWEAWKLTKEAPLVFEGPFRMGPGAAVAPPP